MDIGTVIDIVLLGFLLITAFAVVVMRHLFAVVMVAGVYSLLSALFFADLDAVDVAFTEAAVGAGISTVLLLGGIMLTSRREKVPKDRRAILPLLVVFATGAALVYGTMDMPNYGDPDSPVNSYVGKDYLTGAPGEDGVYDLEIPNIVTAILASFRGYDTLGETVVVFTAGLGVFVLLGYGAGTARRKEEDET